MASTWQPPDWNKLLVESEAQNAEDYRGSSQKMDQHAGPTNQNPAEDHRTRSLLESQYPGPSHRNPAEDYRASSPMMAQYAGPTRTYHNTGEDDRGRVLREAQYPGPSHRKPAEDYCASSNMIDQHAGPTYHSPGDDDRGRLLREAQYPGPSHHHLAEDDRASSPMMARYSGATHHNPAENDRASSLLKALAAGPTYPRPAEIDPAAISDVDPTWTTTSTAFVPMMMTVPDRSLQVLSGQDILARQVANCSLNYHGDPTRWRNRNAVVPNHKNTSLWITRLPSGVTYKELLGAVRNMGRVWSSYINQPEPHRRIYTAAAKLVFFEADAAQRFLAQCHAPHGPGLVLRGHRATVKYNRNKKIEEQTNHFSDAQPHSLPPSRVLVITGPPFVVHPPSMFQYFTARFHFNLEAIVPILEANSFCVYEWQFSSFNCQAEAAFMAINRDHFFRAAGVTVAYGIDPCDRLRGP